MTLLLPTILKLKRTLSPQGVPLGYREIGDRLGLTGAGVRYHVKDRKNCCPNCLRPLEKEKGEK